MRAGSFVDLGKILVGFEHVDRLLDAGPGGAADSGISSWLRMVSTLLPPNGVFRVDFHQEIQAQILERVAVALARIGDLQDRRHPGRTGGWPCRRACP